MLPLLLAIISSSSIALLFKHTETRNMNRYAVTATNYLAAVVISLIMTSWRGWPNFSAINLSDDLGTIGNRILDAQRLTADLSPTYALALGCLAGVVFFLGFIYYQLSVRRHGMGLASAFIKLGILVPMSLSLVLWQEYPSIVQWAGIVLALASIGMVNWPTGQETGMPLRTALLLLFLFGGLAEFSNKVFQKYGLQDDKPLFLMATFGVAFFASAIATALKNRRVTGREILLGIMVGIPNLFASYFLIQALESIPAAVAFPLFGAGTIVIVNLAGILIFKEKLSRLEIVAVGMTVVAMVLINL